MVYATDLGLATERRDHQIQTDPTGVVKRHLIGTAYFASINGHLGIREYFFPLHPTEILIINLSARSLR